PHHLHDAAGVAEVDEDYAAVVPAPRYPAGSTTCSPACAARSVPASWVRIIETCPSRYCLRIFAYRPRRGPDSGVRPVRNGLVRRSAPMVVCGPCPDSTTVSSGRVRQTRARLRRIVG